VLLAADCLAGGGLLLAGARPAGRPAIAGYQEVYPASLYPVLLYPV